MGQPRNHVTIFNIHSNDIHGSSSAHQCLIPCLKKGVPKLLHINQCVSSGDCILNHIGCDKGGIAQGCHVSLLPICGKCHVCLDRFLSFGTFDTFGQIIFYCGDCPVHYKMCSSIPGLYPVDASSPLPPVITTKNMSRY